MTAIPIEKLIGIKNNGQNSISGRKEILVFERDNIDENEMEFSHFYEDSTSLLSTIKYGTTDATTSYPGSPKVCKIAGIIGT